MSGAELLEVVDRTLPIVVFLLTITVVAAAADAAGVFDVAGHTAARVAGLRVVLLWLLLAGLAIVVTAVGALASNLVNNLPALMALESVADDGPRRLMALLIGTNVAPVVTRGVRSPRSCGAPGPRGRRGDHAALAVAQGLAVALVAGSAAASSLVLAG